MAGNSYNQVEVSRSALQHNYHLLKKHIKTDTGIMAMVKADAYGHGMCESSLAFSEVGCNDFGVAEINEGVRLREFGIKGNILVFLGFVPSDTALFFEYDLVPVVYDIKSVQLLSAEAIKQNKEIDVHVKVDCGMTRLGIFSGEFKKFVAVMQTLPGIRYAGVASHFPRADERDSSHTDEQLIRFKSLGSVADMQVPGIVAHTANSGGILYFSQSSCDLVRAGISLYGYYPDGIAGVRRAIGEKLIPVMTFKTIVLQVKTVPARTGVSYGHTYRTTRKTLVAVLPVGYEDGLSRTLSNKGEVLIHGKRAPVIGRICMNLTMIDVTEIGNVESGDEVVILGNQGNEAISADEIGELTGSISYEVLCMFGNNNERTHIK